MRGRLFRVHGCSMGRSPVSAVPSRVLVPLPDQALIIQAVRTDKKVRYEKDGGKLKFALA